MAAAQVPLSPWSPDKKHSDRERWICVYPAYINSKKSRQEGRRLAKEHCIDNPTYQEIKDVLGSAPVIWQTVAVENKLYPREKSKELLSRGRIRVQIKKDDGSLLSPEFPSRDSILLYCGKMIPQLKGRQAGAKAGGEGSSQQAAGSSKKGGKGKRR